MDGWVMEGWMDDGLVMNDGWMDRGDTEVIPHLSCHWRRLPGLGSRAVAEQITPPAEGWVYLWLLGGTEPSAVPGVSLAASWARLCVGLSWDESAVP